MSAMKNPRNCWGVSSWALQVCLVGCSIFCFKLPAFVKSVGNSFLYLLSGTVFTSAPGSTFTRIGLLPCLVIICKVVWNDIWPSDATSVDNLSWGLGGLSAVRWLTWWGLGVGLLLHLLVQLGLCLGCLPLLGECLWLLGLLLELLCGLLYLDLPGVLK